MLMFESVDEIHLNETSFSSHSICLSTFYTLTFFFNFHFGPSYD